MGSGKFDTKKYYDNAATYVKQERTSLFKQPGLSSDFNPLQISGRESCASKEHPDPTSIIITCDVTGSMGKIPENLLKGGLGHIMESLLKIPSISNPQVMFAAIGDTEYDRAPLQVTQFESDNRIEAQLKNLYLEGGGGGNKTESYHAIWYFAAYKTQLDSLKSGKKGLLFTIGDEMVPTVLKADHIRKFIDKDYQGTDISTSQLINDLTKKYEVFHFVVQDTSTYQQIGEKQVNHCWQQYLGERAVLVPQHTEIPEKMISTIRSLCELQMNQAIQAKSERGETKKESPIPAGAAVQLDHFGAFSSQSTALPPMSSAAVLSKDTDNVPHLFICPLSLGPMEDPVIAEDGFTYDRAPITQWLQDHSTSPKTNLVMGKLLIDNRDLKNAITQWKEEQASLSALSTLQLA